MNVDYSTLFSTSNEADTVSIIFEKFLHRKPIDPENDPGLRFYSNLDPEVSRDYDAALVEHGLMSLEQFNETYPEQPFVPEEIYELRSETAATVESSTAAPTEAAGHVLPPFED